MHRHSSPFLLLAVAAALGGCATSASSGASSGASSVASSGPIDRAEFDLGERAPPFAAAQDEGRSRNDLLRAGDLELQLAATGGNDEDFEAGAGALALAANFYINDHGTAATVRQGLSFSDPGPGPDNWDGSSRLGIQQNFETGTSLVPFIGASVGRVYGDRVDESWTGGPEAGVKWYLKPEAFAALAVEYQFLFDNDDRVGDVAEDGNFIYLLSFGLKF